MPKLVGCSETGGAGQGRYNNFRMGNNSSYGGTESGGVAGEQITSEGLADQLGTQSRISRIDIVRLLLTYEKNPDPYYNFFGNMLKCI